MRRGSLLEREAALAYEFMTDTATEPVGFIPTDDRRYGASPDRLIGNDGLLEAKCPMRLRRDLDHRHWPQLQGQLLVAEREFVDWVCYLPAQELVVWRCYRHETYIQKLPAALDAFCDKVDEMTESHHYSQGSLPIPALPLQKGGSPTSTYFPASLGISL